MPVYLRPNELYVKNPNGSGYLPQNVISETSTAEMLAAFDETIANTQESLDTITAAAQSAVDGIESQKNTMIASIASVAGQGTDTTLSQSGVAADAKTVGDLKSALIQTANPLGVDMLSVDNNFRSIIKPLLMHGYINGQGEYSYHATRWVTMDYLPIRLMRSIENNTGANLYIDYYRLVNGDFTFVKYVTVSDGTSYNFNTSDDDVYFRLCIFANETSRNFELKVLNPFYASQKGLAYIFPSKNGSPNLNTTNNTFTIPSRTTIFYGTYNVESYYTLPNDAVIDLTSIASNKRAIRIDFNTANKTFVVNAYNTGVTANLVTVAYVHYYRANPVPTVYGIWMNCQVLVDGKDWTNRENDLEIGLLENHHIVPSFVIGGVDDSSGADKDNTIKRVRSGWIPVKAGVTTIKVRPVIPDMIFWLFIADINHDFITTYGDYWATEVPLEGIDVNIQTGSYIRIIGAITGYPDLTEIGLHNISQAFEVYNAESKPDWAGDITDLVKYCKDYYLYSDGSLHATEGSATTRFIEAIPGSELSAKIWTTGTEWIGAGLYDENHQFIRRMTFEDAKTEGDTRTVQAFVPIPTNGFIKYVRFSYGAGFTDHEVRQTSRMPLPKYNYQSVNHRGFNQVAPENTLIAFKLSKAVGFDMIESDVQFTGDENPIPVILHDGTINRTARNADGTAISETVNIADITYQEALTYDFGVFVSPYFAGTKIPTFEELIVLCKNIGLRFRIELKSEAFPAESANNRIDKLIQIIEKHGMKNNVEFASFGHDLINYIADTYPDYDIGYIKSSINQTFIDTVSSAMSNSHKVTAAVSVSNTPENFALLAETGCIIDVYTVSTDAAVVSADSHVTSFTTNRPNAGEVMYRENM